MKKLVAGRGALVWTLSLALTLVVLAADSGLRLASIREISARRVSATPAPVPDSRSPTGYGGNAHVQILPAIDGYQWVLQTERMMAGGGGRIRSADYDDAPAGREVHWSGVMRWWAAGVAGVYGGLQPGLSRAQALERVTPWANAAILVVLLLALTPTVARRLGAVSGALFALGSVAVFPFYEYFVVGYFDHHGVATMAALLTVVCLAGGGAGWVRDEAWERAEEPRTSWLPTHPEARRWFVASAVCGAVSLWVNAAAIVPVLIGVGIGAMASPIALGPGDARLPVRAHPGLWRVWGFAGGAASLALYLLEYFPSHLGLRLEVNHPLYALAWAAGGDLLYRMASASDPGGDRKTRWAMVAADALAIALVPAVVVLGGERVFRIADPFLYTLHQRFIVEFLPLPGQLAAMAPRVVAGRASALPLLALPLAAVLWPTEARRWTGRGVGLAALVVGVAYAHVVVSALAGGRTAVALVVDAALVGIGFGLCLARGGRPVPAPTRAALTVGIVPAVLLLGMSLAQVRWVGIAAALWLGVLVVASGVLMAGPAPWTAARRAVTGAILALTFLVAPALFLSLPLDSADPPQEVARDASWWLRRRVGDARAVVFTSPNATTWMAYFGGFPGIGTLYWENLDGLRAATTIYTAPTADSLRTLLAARGVTHLVLYPWDRGFEMLGSARDATNGSATAEPYLAALLRAMRSPGVADLPPWLSPLPYRPPTIPMLGQPAALILEITPDQRPETTLLREAEYYQVVGAPEATEAALRASIAAAPTAAAWAMLAQLESARGDAPAFAAALSGLRTALATAAPMDTDARVNAAIALAVGRDGVGAARELDAALAGADEPALRRLSLDHLGILVRLAQQLGLDRAHPETIAKARSLLPPG